MGITQKELIVEGIKMLNENKEKLLLRLKKKKDNTKEMTERFLKMTNKYRLYLGENWLEEIDTTL